MEAGPKLCLLEMTKKFTFMTVQFRCLDSDPLVNSWQFLGVPLSFYVFFLYDESILVMLICNIRYVYIQL